ncbi:ABC transporter substrate-binding protein [Pseudothauera rhizosphaerae]|uniref:ABC transporter substrate-binding protein n=1 Tax=Pseudothauera rhizosphaerae TaxID=2565932 RepID=UPI001E445033|nr:ABC transporter substrate binding protein [Pseudothauera rhizosphaerae]
MFAAVCLLAAPAAHAHEVALVLTQKGGAYGTFAEALAAAAGGRHRIELAGNLEDGVDAAVLERAAVIVAAGAPAMDEIARRGTRPTLGVLVGRSQFDGLRRDLPNARLSAIVLDQPAERHLALVRAILPDAQRVGILFGPASSSLAPAFGDAARSAGLALGGQHISTAGELLPALERLLESSDALLALADPLVSGPTAARTLLLTSYRYRRPVFAYSRAYVEAGALAAVFSTPEDAAREVAAWLDGAPRSGSPQLPDVRAPRGFDIAINRQVARALGLEVPDNAGVLERLRGGNRP